MNFPVVSRIGKLLAGVFICAEIGMATTSAARFAGQERKLPNELKELICQRDLASSDLLKFGLFDAQVSIVKFKPSSSNTKVTKEQVKARAISLAKEQEQFSYSYGQCENGSAWAMGFPAPSVVAIEDGFLKVPDTAKGYCVPGSLKVAFVPENKGRSMSIVLDEHLMAELPKTKGYVSVSCVHSGNPNSGHREWALIPLQGAKSSASELFELNGSTGEESIFAWINEQRKIMNLTPLELNIDLVSAARISSGDLAIRHNRKGLRDLKKTLGNRSVEAMGEDRVSGFSLNELAGLLWMSPSHRDLLVDPSAEMVGCSVEKTDRGFFAVIITGKKAAGNIAKNNIDNQSR